VRVLGTYDPHQDPRWVLGTWASRRQHATYRKLRRWRCPMKSTGINFELCPSLLPHGTCLSVSRAISPPPHAGGAAAGKKNSLHSPRIRRVAVGPLRKVRSRIGRGGIVSVVSVVVRERGGGRIVRTRGTHVPRSGRGHPWRGPEGAPTEQPNDEGPKIGRLRLGSFLPLLKFMVTEIPNANVECVSFFSCCAQNMEFLRGQLFHLRPWQRDKTLPRRP
jgi:hypothetical protein